MKQQKFNLKEHLQLIPSDPPREKRPRDKKKTTWPDEKIRGNTGGGLQLTLWSYKGQQTNI